MVEADLLLVSSVVMVYLLLELVEVLVVVGVLVDLASQEHQRTYV